MEKRFLWLGGFIIVGILLGAGLIFLVSRPPRGEPVTLLPAPTSSPIIVYVTGQVTQPGVYSLSVGSRVDDAIQAAGGFSSDANTTAINLAEVLADGQKINVPNMATQVASEENVQPDTVGFSPIDINTASLEQLDTLPGIGPATAQDIIDYRSSSGNFTRIEDIMNVPGIGQGKFDAIKDLITVGMSP
jgi:competence protein ComEA